MPAQQLAMQDLVCTDCSQALTDDTRSHEDLQVCDDCRNEVIGYCDFCGEHYMQEHSSRDTAARYGVWHVEHMTMVESEYICTGCIQRCNECGAEYAFEATAWECCPPPDEDEDSATLHYYSFRPSMKFWSLKDDLPVWGRYPRPGILYMGIEIEVEKALHHVKEMVDNDGNEDWFNPNFYYWKHDGSLGTYGAEMVTMPATLDAHKLRFPYAKLDWLHEQGARAWAYESCGMHIHVSRTAFTAPHMWKFIKFQLHNHDVLAQIAGRNSRQWASWGNETMQDARKNAAKYVKREPDEFANRYSALNFNNSETIELRYFRSNISKHGIIRNLELVHAMWAYTKDMTVRDYIRDGWGFEAFMEFIASRLEYAIIHHYIKREGLA